MIETRALNALWRRHPDTPPNDRYGEKAQRHAYAERDKLLRWAADQPDARLLEFRNLGVTTLAWIRAQQTTTGPVPTLRDAARAVVAWSVTVQGGFDRVPTDRISRLRLALAAEENES